MQWHANQHTVEAAQRSTQDMLLTHSMSRPGLGCAGLAGQCCVLVRCGLLVRCPARSSTGTLMHTPLCSPFACCLSCCVTQQHVRYPCVCHSNGVFWCILYWASAQRCWVAASSSRMRLAAKHQAHVMHVEHALLIKEYQCVRCVAYDVLQRQVMP